MRRFIRWDNWPLWFAATFLLAMPFMTVRELAIVHVPNPPLILLAIMGVR